MPTKRVTTDRGSARGGIPVTPGCQGAEDADPLPGPPWGTERGAGARRRAL